MNHFDKQNNKLKKGIEVQNHQDKKAKTLLKKNGNFYRLISTVFSIGTIIGFIIALVTMIIIIQTVKIAWPLYTVVGSLTTIITGMITSKIFKKTPDNTPCHSRESGNP